MGFVWRHPSLLCLEVLWRWLVAAPLLLLALRALAPGWSATPLNVAALEGMTFFEPVRSLGVLARQLRLYLPLLQQTARWWVPLSLVVWALAAALGRAAVVRRAARLSHGDTAGSSRHAWGAVIVPTLGRALAFLALLSCWLFALRAALRSTLSNAFRSGAEPNLVLFTAEAVALTLAAFVLWSVTVWLFDLRFLEDLTGIYLRRRSGRARLRSKLIEANLVMGIVRVALLVLALTFSASPLPFQSRETQAYINVWWIGVALFYMLSSDAFHVVRRITYLRLLQSIAAEINAAESAAS